MDRTGVEGRVWSKNIVCQVVEGRVWSKNIVCQVVEEGFAFTA